MWLAVLAPLVLAASSTSTLNSTPKSIPVLTLKSTSNSNLTLAAKTKFATSFPSSLRTITSPITTFLHSNTTSSTPAIKSSVSPRSPSAAVKSSVFTRWPPVAVKPSASPRTSPVRSAASFRISPLAVRTSLPPLSLPPPPPIAALMMAPAPRHAINNQLINDIKAELRRDNDDYKESVRRSLPQHYKAITREVRRRPAPGGPLAPALAVLLPTRKAGDMLIQPIQPTPRPRRPMPRVTVGPRRPLATLPQPDRPLLWPRPDPVQPIKLPIQPLQPPVIRRPRPLRPQYPAQLGVPPRAHPSVHPLGPRYPSASKPVPRYGRPQHDPMDLYARTLTTRTSNNLIKSRKRAKLKRLVKFIKKNKNLLRQLIETKREREHTGRLGALFEGRALLREEEAVPRATENLRAEQLDAAHARGFKVANMRLKGRVCQRSVMNAEGPKYNEHGRAYKPEFQAKKGRSFIITKPPEFLLPICCNCCAKSVLGCE